jgi:hypothetical protein
VVRMHLLSGRDTRNEQGQMVQHVGERMNFVRGSSPIGRTGMHTPQTRRGPLSGREGGVASR